MRLFPRGAVRFAQHHLVAGTACGEFGKECPPFIGQHDMARLAGL